MDENDPRLDVKTHKRKKYTICVIRTVTEYSWWTIEAYSEKESLELYKHDGDEVDIEMDYTDSRIVSETVEKVENIA